MAYTLLDAAYAMYYPEAEFGIKDTLSRLKSRVKKTGNRLKTKARGAFWRNQGYSKSLKADRGLRAVYRTNTKRNPLTVKRAMSEGTARTYMKAHGL